MNSLRTSIRKLSRRKRKSDKKPARMKKPKRNAWAEWIPAKKFAYGVERSCEYRRTAPTRLSLFIPSRRLQVGILLTIASFEHHIGILGASSVVICWSSNVSDAARAGTWSIEPPGLVTMLTRSTCGAGCHCRHIAGEVPRALPRQLPGCFYLCSSVQCPG